MPNEKTTKIARKCLEMDTNWDKKERYAKNKHQVEDRGIGSYRIVDARLKFEEENKY